METETDKAEDLRAPGSPRAPDDQHAGVQRGLQKGFQRAGEGEPGIDHQSLVSRQPGCWPKAKTTGGDYRHPPSAHQAASDGAECNQVNNGERPDWGAFSPGVPTRADGQREERLLRVLWKGVQELQ